jgi:hypothetical protein
MNMKHVTYLGLVFAVVALASLHPDAKAFAVDLGWGWLTIQTK